MPDMHPPAPYYIATILLERNRWKPPKEPTYRVSEWIDRFADAGFAGMELWENHALRVPEAEKQALERSSLPVVIFNSYAGLGDDHEHARREAADLARRLGARAIKYNFGKDWSARETYLHNLESWSRTLPAHVRFLCECHPGTIMEDPEQAETVFAQLDPGRHGAMVHAFSTDLAELEERFARFGPRIEHVHVQARDGNGRWVGLERICEGAQRALEVLKSAGFNGTFSFEFTEGTGLPDEDMEELFAAACRDLAFLRDHWEA